MRPSSLPPWMNRQAARFVGPPSRAADIATAKNGHEVGVPARHGITTRGDNGKTARALTLPPSRTRAARRRLRSERSGSSGVTDGP
jgi:hypothetical protein